MLKIFLSYLVLFGLKNNVITANGSGALEFQREKMYRFYRYINTLLLILGIIVVAMINYVLETYVYSKFDLHFVGFTVIVFLSGLYGLIVSAIWKKASHFGYYLYKSSYSYAFDLVYTVSVVLMMNINTGIAYYLIQLLAVAIVIMLMSAIVGFFVRSMNRGYMNINFRNVSARLFLLAFISILLHYAGLLVA